MKQRKEESSIIPIILCIDVEPNKRVIDVDIQEEWTGYLQTFKYMEDFRKQVIEKTLRPCNFSWFYRIDRQIETVYSRSHWILEHYQTTHEQILKSGDEVGLHVHAWQWDEKNNEWFSDHGNQNYINGLLEDAFKKFRGYFKRDCRSFRFGDHWMNGETLRLLQKLGVRYDFTLEPGRKKAAALNPDEKGSGELPDLRRMPREPFSIRFSESKDNENDFWILPTCAGFNIHPGVNPVKQSIKRALKRLKILNWIAEEKPLNLGYTLPSAFKDSVDDYLARKEFPHLILVMRTDACISGIQLKKLTENLDYLMAHPLAKSFQFVRPDDLIQQWNQCRRSDEKNNRRTMTLSEIGL